METIAFCEYDKKAQLILKKHWPDVPIFEDVTKLNGNQLKPLYPIELICGGFPCQPFSVAGKQRGKEDDRYLWPEYFRLIQEIRPRWVIGENVAGLIGMGLDEVLYDLESANYSCQAVVIPACAINAPHRRDRVWICAYTGHSNCGVFPGTSPETKRGFQEGFEQFQSWGEVGNLRPNEKILADTQSHGDRRVPRSMGKEKKDSKKQNDGAIFNSSSKNVADSEAIGIQGSRAIREQESETYGGPELFMCNSSEGGRNFRATKSGVGGMVDGIPKGLDGHWDIEPPGIPRIATGIKGRTDRLKQLGNAVVPQIVEIIGRAIMGVESAQDS